MKDHSIPSLQSIQQIHEGEVPKKIRKKGWTRSFVFVSIFVLLAVGFGLIFTRDMPLLENFKILSANLKQSIQNQDGNELRVENIGIFYSENKIESKLREKRLLQQAKSISSEKTPKKIQVKVDAPAPSKKPKNFAMADFLVARVAEKLKQTNRTVVKIPNYQRMQFPSEKYANMPKTILKYEETQIEMHHEVLNPILPEDGKNWFRRVTSHRYSFPHSPDTPIEQKQQLQTYHFLNNLTGAVDFIKSNILSTSDATQLSKAMYFNWYNHKYIEAEFAYFDTKYNISDYENELPFCIVATGRNLRSRNLFYDFFRTVSQQNYSNYKVVAVDDNSTDSTLQAYAYYITKYFPKLKDRTVIITNQESIGAFNNKDSSIKQNCDIDDIVVDFDLDDMLVGRQVLKTLNAVYQQRPELKVVYSNFLVWNKNTQVFWLSNNEELTEEKFQNYRKTLGYWRTSHLKTYRKKLYDLVPLSYLADLNHVRQQDGKVYPIYGRYTSDQYMMLSMIELAGLNSIKYVDEILHLYRKSEEIQASSQCHIKMQEYGDLKNRIKIPLKSIDKFEDNQNIYRIQGYEVPQQIWKAYKEKENEVKTNCSANFFNPFYDQKELLYKNLAQMKSSSGQSKPSAQIDEGNIAKILGFKLANVSAVFISTGLRKTLNETLSSFFQTNSYPLDKIIVLWDGVQTENLRQLMKVYNNVTWIVTNTTIGQVAAYDLAFNSVKSEYVLISQDNIKFIRKRFIQYSIQRLQSNASYSQIVLKHFQGVFADNVSLIDDLHIGFSFKPSMYRLKSFEQFEGGYVNLTRNVSYGKDGLLAENIMHAYSYEKGHRVYTSNITFISEMTTDDEQPLQWPKYKYNIYDIKKKVTEMDQNLKNTCWYVSRSTKADRKRYRILQKARDVIRIKLDEKWVNKGKPLQKQAIEFMKNESIQIGSRLHSNRILDEDMSTNFTQNFTKSFYLELLELDKIKKRPHTEEKVGFENFKDVIDVERYLYQLNQTTDPINLKEKNLAKELFKNRSVSKDKKVLQAQYHYYNQKYSLDEIIVEQSLCIFVEGHDILDRSNYTKMFQSIENQNYTNYHIIIVDDSSTSGQTASRIATYIKQKHPRIYNKVKHIAKNQQRLYTGGNIRIRATQLCGESDIVVNVGANTQLIGRQAFNVINAIYQNNEVWLALFRSFSSDENGKLVQPKEFPIKLNQNYRTVAVNNIEISLKTFRNEVVRLIPIEHLTEFIYNEEIKMYTPHFYKIQSQISILYSLLEICGILRLKTLEDILFYYEPLSVKQKCKAEEDMYALRKIQIKSPVKALGNFKSKAKLNDLYVIPNSKLVQLKKAHDDLLNCKKAVKKEEDDQLLKEIKEKQFQEFIEEAKNKFVYPNHFVEYYKIRPYDELPFCIVINEKGRSPQDLNNIIESIVLQNFNNKRLIVSSQNQEHVLKKKKLQVLQLDFRMVTLKNQSYYEHLQMLKANCPKNSLVMYIGNPLIRGIFHYLNELHQKFNTWITYSYSSKSISIHTFYLRIFQLIGLNDFSGSNRAYLDKGDRQLQTLAFLELSAKFSYRIRLDNIYLFVDKTVDDVVNSCYYSASTNNKEVYKRRPYDVLYKMSQDFREDIKEIEQNRKNIHSYQGYFFKPLRSSQMNKVKLMKAVQYQQLLFLPQQHSLAKRQYLQYHEQYGIGDYPQRKQYQVPICLAVFGRNNTQNHRHFKNVESILQQNYTNYHVVYVDDDSDDKTLEEVMDMFKAANFPQDRITYVKNKNRKFATYAIVNTAFNFCGLDEIQVILDGDDELIGRQVLNLVNAAYQKNPQAWVIYTNFKSSNYGYGVGFHRPDQNQYKGCDGRVNAHYLTPLRTWRVKFIRSIPLIHHQLQYGGWLDTLYDEGLQYIMLELAGPSRFFYIPVITYQYNRSYGSNDDSNRQKILHRFGVLSYVHSYTMSQPLNSLQDHYKNQQIDTLLKSDIDKEFYVLRPSIL